MTKTKLTPLQSETVTPRQKEVLEHITVFYKKHGYPVTQTWVARQIGVKKSTMTDHIKALISKGLILKTPDGQVYPKPKK